MMAQAYITRRGGGGLNFAVKGYPTSGELPATAKENTIAVITDVTIPDWEMSAADVFADLESESLYDAAGDTAAYYIRRTDGVPVASGNWIATDYIDVTAYHAIVLANGGGSANSTAGHVFFDAEKNYLSGVNVTAAKATIAVPEGAAYVRCTIYASQQSGFNVVGLYHRTEEEGFVQIRCGSSSTLPFSASKTETVMLYPLNAFQYTGGAWVKKNFWIYQDGEWKGSAYWLFKSGDGLVGEITGFSSGTQSSNEYYRVSWSQGAGSDVRSDGYRYSLESVDITNYSTATFRLTARWGAGGSGRSKDMRVRILGDDGTVASKTLGSGKSANTVIYSTPTPVTIDISGMTGPAKFGFHVCSFDSAHTYTFDLYDLYLEA